MECNLSTFADDNKLGGAHAWRTGDLEEGLDRLEHWAISSGMNFSNSRMLGVALVTEQCHMQVQTRRQEAEREQLSRKGPGSVCWWQQSQHELEMCPGSQERKLLFGVH